MPRDATQAAHSRVRRETTPRDNAVVGVLPREPPHRGGRCRRSTRSMDTHSARGSSTGTEAVATVRSSLRRLHRGGAGRAGDRSRALDGWAGRSGVDGPAGSLAVVPGAAYDG